MNKKLKPIYILKDKIFKSGKFISWVDIVGLKDNVGFKPIYITNSFKGNLLLVLISGFCSYLLMGFIKNFEYIDLVFILWILCVLVLLIGILNLCRIILAIIFNSRNID